MSQSLPDAHVIYKLEDLEPNRHVNLPTLTKYLVRIRHGIAIGNRPLMPCAPAMVAFHRPVPRTLTTPLPQRMHITPRPCMQPVLMQYLHIVSLQDINDEPHGADLR
jgi:hypothetical protein